ncbi:antibiotic biosynthesis monooxygenase family protein [Simiduia agarivorans]|uniref:ABM domain-containing protein n=1 Tax=Simiduia agarivorans (strain DSM 21679 / JCM 13881 / BCRC 17597 / SA1) TaxID=1117647 RepID=K4KPQ3_SIMAS|nr:hypothetical protein [Simiduia agarivorans]AFV00114.1 hypothetical protein M5M_14895 [Simiduia agarivorans SA1 = DSM 21679]
MQEVSIINHIVVPAGMQSVAESIRDQYIAYFKTQDGFVSSTFYRSLDTEADGSIKYVNTVVWQSFQHYQAVVNKGFSNPDGLNNDGYKVLGKGFPEPIRVSPGRYIIVADNQA